MENSQESKPATEEPVDQSYSFTYYWNSQEDAHGRNTGMLDGFRDGDTLQIAFRGLFECAFPVKKAEDLESVAEVLFVVFNDPDRRPAEYRGPSMSVGSVLEIQGKCFAVAPCGFVPVEIWKCPIEDGNPRWSSAFDVRPLPRLNWRLRWQQSELQAPISN
jgi:hypothetical protein